MDPEPSEASDPSGTVQKGQETTPGYVTVACASKTSFVDRSRLSEAVLMLIQTQSQVILELTLLHLQ